MTVDFGDNVAFLKPGSQGRRAGKNFGYEQLVSREAKRYPNPDKLLVDAVLKFFQFLGRKIIAVGIIQGINHATNGVLE
ncbi:hypothetical protein D1872_269140 [compost metagenome]